MVSQGITVSSLGITEIRGYETEHKKEKIDTQTKLEEEEEQQGKHRIAY